MSRQLGNAICPAVAAFALRVALRRERTAGSAGGRPERALAARPGGGGSAGEVLSIRVQHLPGLPRLVNAKSDAAGDARICYFVERAGGGQTFDATVGARALFALVVGALDVFNSLADDLNDPFRGQFTLESTP